MFNHILLDQSIILYKAGKYQESAKILNDIIKSNEDNYYAYYYLGNIFLKQKKISDAEMYLKKCIQINNQIIDAPLKLSHLYFKIDDLKNANYYLDMALKLNPDNKDCLRQKANILENTKNYEEALSIYEKLELNLTPKEMEIKEAQIIKYKIILYNFKEAEGLIPKLKEKNEALAEDLTLLLLVTKGNFEDALFELRAKGKDDSLFKSYIYYYCNYKVKNFELVVKKYTENEEKFKDNKSIYAKLIILYTYFSYRYLEKSEYSNTFNYYKNNNKDWDNEYYNYEYANYYLIKKNNESKFKEFILKALEINKNYAPAVLLYDDYLKKKGKKEDAEKFGKENEDIISRFSKIPESVTFTLNYSQSKIFRGNESLSITTNDKGDTTKDKGELIGKGGFGKVWKRKINGKTYAIKEVNFRENYALSAEEYKKRTIEFRNEVYKMMFLIHTNVIYLHGFQENEIQLEYADGGNLYCLLRENKNIPLNFKVKLAFEICQGLEYLHDKKIIHGDFKSKNILLDKKYNISMNNYQEIHPKICDFGLSAMTKNNEDIVECEGISFENAAPEQPDGSISHKSDIFSFGLILYEIFTGKMRVLDGRNFDEKMESVKKGKLPNFDNELTKSVCPEDFKKIIKKCCEINPDDRPNIKDLVEEIKTIKKNLKL